MSVKRSPVRHVLIADERNSRVDRNSTFKGFFSLRCMARLLARAEHKALPFLDSPVPCWRFPPNLFPIRAGRGGRCPASRGTGGELCSVRSPAAHVAALRAGPCAFVMNHPAIVCSPPCCRDGAFTWAAACARAFFQAGKRRSGRKGCSP